MGTGHDDVEARGVDPVRFGRNRSAGGETTANRHLQVRAPTLYARAAESAALDQLLDAARAGRSAALVLHGERGIGKSELLEHTVDRATEFRVARAVGVESETEIAFAGLHQLCGQLLERLDRLAPPQRQALTTTFGLSTGGSPDPFVVGVAVLNLLAKGAEEEPLLCVIDDADRFDRASMQTLGFVARRLSAESIALVFGLSAPSPELAGVPELRVEGLDDSAARALLESTIACPLDERVRDRLLAEARGNPLALLQLPQALTPAELAGGSGLPASLPREGALEESLREQLERLPTQTRLLLLLAAAEPVGDPALLRRAAARLGLDTEAAAPPEVGGPFTLGINVAFRDPLVRSVVYHAAPPRSRSAVHRALAEIADPAIDPDRRAWHRAQAALRADDEIADELEGCADRAKARGGLAAAAAFLERAVVLTSEPAHRAERALGAAQAMHEAGDSEKALDLLPLADAGLLDELHQGLLERLKAQIAFALRTEGNAPALLVRAAKRLESLDERLARDTYLEAMYAAVFAGPAGGTSRVVAVAEAARTAPASPDPRPVDILLDGLAARLTEGHAAAAPILRLALVGFHASDIRWHLLAFHAADDLWDDDAAHALAGRMVTLARRRKELAWLTPALSCRAYRALCEGAFGVASRLLGEAQSVAAATGGTAPASLASLLLAWRGCEEEVDGAATEYANAVLNNGLGRYDVALVAAQRALVQEELLSPWILPELIEAAARSGDVQLAEAAVERLCRRARASGTGLALAVESVGHALVSHGNDADRLYREGVERFGRTRIATYRARAHLLYGEWLRREGRRLEARAQLQTANELFATMGAEAFAARAARELRATGQRARSRSVQAAGQLTLREAQVAEFARDGHTNKEIASRLFISARTVEYHLHKVYNKLGIASRNQLHRVLPGGLQPSRPRTLASPSVAVPQR